MACHQNQLGNWVSSHSTVLCQLSLTLSLCHCDCWCYAIFFKVVKSWDRVIRSNDKSVRKTEVASDEFDCCSFRTKCQHSWQQMWYRDSNLAKQRWSFKSTYATGRLWITGSKIVCVLVCGISKVWLSVFNSPSIYNKEEFIANVETEDHRRGMITVSNHHSCMDDPLLWGMRKWSDILFNNNRTRYTPTAEEVCFIRPSYILFFSLGRCVPVVRGDGVYQPGMDYCVEKLAEKQWVHIFAEGIINKSKEKMRLKWGVGRLVAECDITPKVLPIFHVGMDSILPNKKPYIPLIGKKVTVLIGQTMDFSHIVSEMKQSNKSKVEIRKYVTDRIQEEIHQLSDKANALHKSRF